MLYCFWKHRHGGVSGWFFLSGFLVLQIVGAGLTLSAGKHGTPSSTAITLTSVGLSPLILAVAGIMKEWVTLAGFLRSKKRRTWAMILEVVYVSLQLLNDEIAEPGGGMSSDTRECPADFG